MVDLLIDHILNSHISAHCDVVQLYRAAEKLLIASPTVVFVQLEISSHLGRNFSLSVLGFILIGAVICSIRTICLLKWRWARQI